MKHLLRLAVHYSLIGMGFGSLCYSLCLWLVDAQPQTRGQIATLVVISAVIGLVSMIFELEDLSFKLVMLGHYLLVYALIALLNQLNAYGSVIFSLSFWLSFSLIYAVIWLVVYLVFIRRVQAINNKLAEKKRDLP